MPTRRHELLSLLQLLAGSLPEAEGADLRRRLAEEEDLRELWRRVSDAWHGPRDAGELSAVSHALPAESIGAFVDGRLAPREAERFEDDCRSDAALLGEVVSLYRFRHAEPLDEAAPARLTERLLQMGGVGSTRVDRLVSAATRAPRDVAEESPATTVAPPAIVHPRSRIARQSPGATGYRALAFVAALVVLLLCLWAGWRLSRDPDASRDAHIAEGPQPEAGATSPQAAHGSGPAVRDDTPRDAVVVQQNPPAATHPADEPPPAPTPDRVAVSQPAGHGQAGDGRAVAWERIHGVIAVSAAGTGVWKGARADDGTEPSRVLCSLPGSWGTGRALDGLRLTLDEDTELALAAPSRSGLPPRMELRRGRMGIRDLPAGTMLSLTLGDTEVPVVIEDDGTLLIVERKGDAARLAVAVGRGSVADVALRRRQFVVWNNGSLGTPQTFADSIAWSSAPETPASFDPAVQQRLLDSEDLLADLAALESSPTVAVRRAAVGWRLALAPEATALASLRSADETTRIAAIAWLMDDPDGDARRAAAWRSVAAELGDPLAARQVQQWLRQAASGRPADRTQFAELLAGLDHAELAVRQIANSCLERITRRKAPAYKADAPAAERRPGIQQWRGIVARGASGRAAMNQRPGRTAPASAPSR